MTESIHTCSYYCNRPECTKAQRDRFRDDMEATALQNREWLLILSDWLDFAKDGFVSPTQADFDRLAGLEDRTKRVLGEKP